MLLATFALTAPFILAGEPAVLPLLPAAFMSDELLVSKASAVTEWPFTVDEGNLRCIDYQGHRSVFFSDIVAIGERDEDGSIKLPRVVVVSSNPLALLLTVADSELYVPFDTLETLVKRLAPFEAMGLELCGGPGETYDDEDF